VKKRSADSRNFPMTPEKEKVTGNIALFCFLECFLAVLSAATAAISKRSKQNR
jgi:hypothetical protein